MKKSHIVAGVAVVVALTAGLGIGCVSARMHAPHAGMAGGPMFDSRDLAALNLTPEQAAQAEAIRTRTREARAQAGKEIGAVRRAAEEELAKDAPDLKRIADLAEQAHARVRGAMHESRDQKLALYATFSPEQKRQVRDVLKAKFERAQHMRGRLREWLDATS